MKERMTWKKKLRLLPRVGEEAQEALALMNRVLQDLKEVKER